MQATFCGVEFLRILFKIKKGKESCRRRSSLRRKRSKGFVTQKGKIAWRTPKNVCVGGYISPLSRLSPFHLPLPFLRLCYPSGPQSPSFFMSEADWLLLLVGCWKRNQAAYSPLSVFLLTCITRQYKILLITRGKKTLSVHYIYITEWSKCLDWSRQKT